MKAKRKVSEPQNTEGLVGHCKNYSFILKENEERLQDF